MTQERLTQIIDGGAPIESYEVRPLCLVARGSKKRFAAIESNLALLEERKPGLEVRGDGWTAAYMSGVVNEDSPYWTVWHVPQKAKYCEASYGELYFLPVLRSAIRGGAVVIPAGRNG